MRATPGPWTAHHFVSDVTPDDYSDTGIYEIEEANEQIGDLFREGEHRAALVMAEANRRLIEAAPSLLEALVGILRLNGSRLDKDLVCAADAAIVKARGQ